ncbi:sulfotransferase family 2 domain-containing protein [Petroclostridium sp. X23]|uniref:sulfotransferase family 2 domain-containing protein n=1 Tax=Petroclostridium sp. X23 TaxID=3045146 RepID=UPI0024ACFC7F|nr:sulfotransferase family 2 domain-containing protein [Petroclostridium sp. X23]WHH57485.1 sulfotransferase family 2 domain-containing protein [Petroclostridium sp. X23]
MIKKMKKFIKKKPKIYQMLSYIYRFFFVDMKNLILFGAIEKKEYIIVPNKKIVYLNNSKVACSSIKSTFILDETPDDYSIHSKVKDLSREYYAHEEREYFKFTFVRNPFDRLVSCYESKYKQDRKLGKKKLHFDDYLFGYLREDKGFEIFLKKVILIPDFLADRHFQSQYKLIYDKKNRCLVDFVGKYENLSKDFSDIQKKYNLGNLPHFNKTTKNNWMDYYNLETAKLVYDKYTKDIEVFEYKIEYQQLLNYLSDKSNFI